MGFVVNESPRGGACSCIKFRHLPSNPASSNSLCNRFVVSAFFTLPSICSLCTAGRPTRKWERHCHGGAHTSKSAQQRTSYFVPFVPSSYAFMSSSTAISICTKRAEYKWRFQMPNIICTKQSSQRAARNPHVHTCASIFSTIARFSASLTPSRRLRFEKRASISSMSSTSCASSASTWKMEDHIVTLFGP